MGLKNKQAEQVPTMHTPGPWGFHAQDNSTMIVTGETRGWGHDHLAYVVTPPGSPEHAANLALVLAAPLMLEALIAAERRLTELGERESNDLLMPLIWRALNKTTPEYAEAEAKVNALREIVKAKGGV